MQLFYKDRPVFGFDIGRSSVKLMQIDQTGKHNIVVCYGTIGFPPEAIDKGVVIDPETVAKATYELISRQMVGKLSSRNVAVSLPNEFCFSRVLQLPFLKQKDLDAAVQAEVEQSIPLPVDQLYYDFTPTRKIDDRTQEIQLVACPRAIVDSYKVVFDLLGLDMALAESNISAVTRIVVHAEAHDVVTLIVDFGSTACDLSIYNKQSLNITGTVDCSGETITSLISEKLGVSPEQAHSIKTRYGLEKSKKQSQIVEAIEPELSKLINEIKKVIRYHAERSGKGEAIGQIIILGGGANLPGLSTYITNSTRIPTRLCAPWANLSFGRLQPPHELETTLYTTAGGLSLVATSEIAK